MVEMHGTPKGLLFAIYYPVITAVGLPANIVVILIFSRGRCGLPRCLAHYLVSMAVTDLLVIITAVILNRITGIYFPFSFMSITPVCSLRIALICGSIDCSAWLTVAFTFDRFVSICCQNLKIKHCTNKTALWIIGIVCTMSYLRNIFWYFVFEPLYVIDNVPWFCVVKPTFYTSPAWVAYDLILVVFSPCLPFIVILLLNALTVRHIIVANRARRRLQPQRSGENQRDPEMEKRRKSIVLLFAISGSFIALYMLYFMTVVYVRIANVTYFTDSDFSDSTFILEENAYMLQFLCSSLNPFIYAGTQRKFREELKRGILYPFAMIVKFSN
ncbi:probable G-protein coupled receptor 139 [Stegostoma tigrinum]|uniref:probable G-protein coupled receptor 139 n=1 Tax=Stegostoma tigrinum TaxID=3053191 RepID=UPI0028700180|nr:probable G-protein coupled receptor 139 [Stegostoma tigrinum]